MVSGQGNCKCLHFAWSHGPWGLCIYLFINKSKGNLRKLCSGTQSCQEMGGRGIVGRLGNKGGAGGRATRGHWVTQAGRTEGRPAGGENWVRLCLLDALSPFKSRESRPSLGHPCVTTGPCEKKGQWNQVKWSPPDLLASGHTNVSSERGFCRGGAGGPRKGRRDGGKACSSGSGDSSPGLRWPPSRCVLTLQSESCASS